MLKESDALGDTLELGDRDAEGLMDALGEVLALVEDDGDRLADCDMPPIAG
jgi:hypothetical protein